MSNLSAGRGEPPAKPTASSAPTRASNARTMTSDRAPGTIEVAAPLRASEIHACQRIRGDRARRHGESVAEESVGHEGIRGLDVEVRRERSIKIVETCHAIDSAGVAMTRSSASMAARRAAVARWSRDL